MERRTTFEHSGLGSTPLACFSNREVPFGGDSSEVNVGPDYRHSVDLSDDGASVFIHPTGQSGNVLSGGFDGLLDMWAEG